jgi:hypothetical protein
MKRGENAIKRQFPWSVYLEVDASWFKFGFCSGVILNRRRILTAAHFLV